MGLSAEAKMQILYLLDGGEMGQKIIAELFGVTVATLEEISKRRGAVMRAYREKLKNRDQVRLHSFNSRVPLKTKVQIIQLCEDWALSHSKVAALCGLTSKKTVWNIYHRKEGILRMYRELFQRIVVHDRHSVVPLQTQLQIIQLVGQCSMGMDEIAEHFGLGSKSVVEKVCNNREALMMIDSDEL